MSDNYIKFIRELKRKTYGMGMKQIADVLLVGPASVYAYMNYKSVMSAETLLRAAQKFGIDISLLLGVSE